MSDLSTDARALIDATRAGDDPDERDKARVRARLVSQLGVGAFAGAAVLTVISSAGGSPVSGTAAVAPVVTRVGTALWVKTLGTVAAVAATAGALYSGSALLDRSQRPRSPERTDAPSTPSTPIRPPTLEPTVEQLVARPEPEVVIAPEKSPKTNDPRAKRAERRLRSVAASPTPAAEPAASPSDATLTAELALLAKAQRALRDGRASAALGLVQQHALRFPEGSLQQERDGIEVLARCMLGDAQALSAARAFLAESPESPLAARVRKECEDR